MTETLQQKIDAMTTQIDFVPNIIRRRDVDQAIQELREEIVSLPKRGLKDSNYTVKIIDVLALIGEKK